MGNRAAHDQHYSELDRLPWPAPPTQVERVDNILYVFQSMYEAGRWPVGLYPPWLRATLTFLVPIAFAITVPASSLVGRLDWRVFGGTVVLAGIMLIASRWFWTRGVRHYAGASA